MIKMQKMGINAHKVIDNLRSMVTMLQEEIFSSSFAAAAYLESLRFDKKVYVCGESGIGTKMMEVEANSIKAQELKEVGIRCVESQELHNRLADWDEILNLQVDQEVLLSPIRP